MSTPDSPAGDEEKAPFQSGDRVMVEAEVMLVGGPSEPDERYVRVIEHSDRRWHQFWISVKHVFAKT